MGLEQTFFSVMQGVGSHLEVVHIDLLPSTAIGESQTLLLPPHES